VMQTITVPSLRVCLVYEEQRSVAFSHTEHTTLIHCCNKVSCVKMSGSSCVSVCVVDM